MTRVWNIDLLTLKVALSNADLYEFNIEKYAPRVGCVNLFLRFDPEL